MYDNTQDKESKFRTRNWVEINDESRGTCSANSVIKFKTLIRSNFCDHSDAYIHVKGTIAVPNTVGVSTAVNNANKKIVFKNCAPFTNCMSETNNTEVDDTADIDLVMPMYS